MHIAVLAFLVMTVAVLIGWAAATHLPEIIAGRRMRQRLADVSLRPDESTEDGAVLVKQRDGGPLPGVDRAILRTPLGTRLSRLIEQSGVQTSPAAIIVISVLVAGAAALICATFVRLPYAPLAAGLLGVAAPTLWLTHRRSVRIKKFEEMFPEALDLLSRAIRAGHAFQTAMGMVAEELHAPVGPEFKKTFDQQNFGLPLRDALNELAERVDLLDVKFFVTAVLIQRDTGGNLAEILDNLAHVVRERFKIRRQVRVHTAHGRFTGYVLLALPAGLAVMLSFQNPEAMETLFKERLGQMMVMGALILQTIGYFWIRKVIKIEV
jgi:tight adherence protein B